MTFSQTDVKTKAIEKRRKAAQIKKALFHSYKSANTTPSQRSRIFQAKILFRLYADGQDDPEDKSNKRNRRRCKKNKKIATHIERCDLNEGLSESADKCMKRMYESERIPDAFSSGFYEHGFISDREGNLLEIVEPKDMETGLCYHADDDPYNIHFLLPPRRPTLVQTSFRTPSVVKALEWSATAEGALHRNANKNGITLRKIVKVGPTVKRGNEGDIGFGDTHDLFKNGNGEGITHLNVLIQQARVLESIMACWTPTKLLRSLRLALNNAHVPRMSLEFAKRHNADVSHVNLAKLEKEEKGFYIGAMATAIDHQAGSHTDDDSMLSSLTINVKHKHSSKIAHLTKNDPVCQYFCFPELGLAVALHPGDILFFNPKYVHCCSKKTATYEKYDVHISSYYLKTGWTHWSE